MGQVMGALARVEPASQAVVTLEGRLVQPHPAPWWVMALRMALGLGAVLGLPLEGAALAVVAVVIWLASGLLVRYPVRLPPGRALFLGGVGNTDVPGRYWLRRRWREAAFSIPLQPLHLRWQPAPTRVQHLEHGGWLELELELWVRPREDEAGQFLALMQYDLWQQHPRQAAKKLREELLEAIVEHLRHARLVERGTAARLSVEEREVEGAIERGLHALGLERVDGGHARVVVTPRTEQLASEDRLWIDLRPAPDRGLAP